MTGTLHIQRVTVSEDQELLIDSFAGGGGASTGIEAATGRPVDYAINHNEAAIIMHRANHPRTVHLHESVWKADPREIVGKGRVGLAWFSPDCTHFSVARGAKPVSPRVRGLAWIMVKWAKLPRHQRPRVMICENVKEFVTWGPLVCKRDAKGNVMHDAKGRALEIPCPRRKGVTFKRWVTTLRNLGYTVEWRELDAADFGAPTHRRRFFLIARCDGRAITWPEPTHGDPRKLAGSMFGPKLTPYRTAAECIDWSLPCPSIFLTREEARVVGKQLGMASLKRPLAENTMRRIANGLLRYVIRAKEPYIVGQGAGTGVVSAFMVKNNFGEKPHYAIDEPMRTQVAGGTHHAQVVAFLAKHFGGMVGTELPRPLPTTTQTGTQNQIVAAHLLKLRGTCKDGLQVDQPAPTISAGGTHLAEVRTFLIKYFGNEKHGLPVNGPASTVTAKERLGLVTVHGEDYQIVDIGMRMLTPRELARCQGFPESYILTGTKTSQVARIGNSVCPPVVEAIVRANFTEMQ